MLTDEELATFKVCDLPYDVAQVWFSFIAPAPSTYDDYLEEGDSLPINQQMEVSGEVFPLAIYKSRDGYHLILQQRDYE
jgi:hypothetical protein